MDKEVVEIRLIPEVKVDSLRIGGQWFYHQPIRRAVSNLSDEILTSEMLIVEEVVEPAPPREPPRPEATRAAVKLADELELDLGEIEGSGKGGRVTVADIRESLEPEVSDG